MVDSEEDNDYELRAGRRTKGSKKTNNKKQTPIRKTQKTRDSSYANQQQAVPLNNGLMANFNMDNSNGLLPPFRNGQPGSNGLGQPNVSINQNFNANRGQQMPSYAAQFPYPGAQYPAPNFGPQNFPGHQVGSMGYFYGNPNIPQNGPYPGPPMPLGPNNFNIINQNPLTPAINPQTSFPNGNAGNFIVNGNLPAAQTGLPNNIGIPQQPYMESQIQIHPENLQNPRPELQFQQGFINPYANVLPQMQNSLQNEFEMSIVPYPLYPRYQRSMKSKEDV